MRKMRRSFPYLRGTNLPDMEKVFIIGAGAIGQVLAVALVRSGRRVVLLRGSTDQQVTTEKNIRVATPDAVLEAPVTFDSLSSYATLDGLIVLANKSFGNAALAQSLKGRTGRSPVVLLQNGLEVEAPFLEAGFPAVYRCVLFATSQFTGEGSLRFKPVAPSAVGGIRGRQAELGDVVAALHTAFFPFSATADIQPVIWKKAIANCVFNSICPLLETDNGIFHRNPEAMNMARRVIAECTAIAREKGVEIGEGEVVDSVLTISRLSDGQWISTLQDIRNKRPTEIDTLNLAIARMAESIGREGDVPLTRALGQLTQLKSNINR